MNKTYTAIKAYEIDPPLTVGFYVCYFSKHDIVVVKSRLSSWLFIMQLVTLICGIIMALLSFLL